MIKTTTMRITTTKPSWQIMCDPGPTWILSSIQLCYGPVGPSPLLRSTIIKENELLRYYTFNKLAARNV